jgi:hypothetical protein
LARNWRKWSYSSARRGAAVTMVPVSRSPSSDVAVVRHHECAYTHHVVGRRL